MELLDEKMKTMESSMSTKLERLDKIEKETETLTETMLDKQLHIETRINDSYKEIVDNLKNESKNGTKLYGEKMDSLLDSLSLKSQELSDNEKERKRKIESIQRDLNEEQTRVHKSYDGIVENYKVQCNKTLQEFVLHQHKEMMEKRETVAFSAYRSSSQTLSSGEKVIFDGVWTNVGKGYEPSTGIFKAPHPGLHNFTAVLMSSNKKDLSLYLNVNELEMTRSYLRGDGYKTETFDVLLNLQKGDTVHIESDSSQSIYSDSSRFIIFSGYMII